MVAEADPMPLVAQTERHTDGADTVAHADSIDSAGIFRANSVAQTSYAGG